MADSSGWRGRMFAACRALFYAGALGLFSSAAFSAVVSYQATSLGANQWRYDYTLSGESPTDGFNGISVYFDDATSSNLQIVGTPQGWDALALQPDSAASSDGYADWLNLAGLLQGTINPISFSVSFEFSGAGTPGAQRFELYLYQDPAFAVVSDGLTSSTGAIPEPATGALVLLALGCGTLLTRHGRGRVLGQ